LLGDVAASAPTALRSAIATSLQLSN